LRGAGDLGTTSIYKTSRRTTEAGCVVLASTIRSIQSFPKAAIEKRCHSGRDAIGAEQDNCLAANTEFSAKALFGENPPSSTELLRRAAETHREVANLLSEHPRNDDGVILLVHLRG
jgi:hypothetical protein